MGVSAFRIVATCVADFEFTHFRFCRTRDDHSKLEFLSLGKVALLEGQRCGVCADDFDRKGTCQRANCPGRETQDARRGRFTHIAAGLPAADANFCGWMGLKAKVPAHGNGR